VVAASFGGISAIREVLSGLPGCFPAPVVVVQHQAATAPVVLAPLFQRHTELRLSAALSDARPEAGTVYFAGAGRQLALSPDGRFTFDAARDGHCFADPLLSTAAATHGNRVLAVILTGRLDDGAAGAAAVKAAGGRVIVQDRATSAAFEMPAAAIATGCVDFVLPLCAIPAAVVTLAMVPEAAALFRVSRAPWATAAA
jgi:two-component system chemotaxis response regulator CheB